MILYIVLPFYVRTKPYSILPSYSSLQWITNAWCSLPSIYILCHCSKHQEEITILALKPLIAMNNSEEWPLKHVQPPKLSFRHLLSRSVTDAPSLRVRWFYAVDRPLRKSRTGPTEIKKAKNFLPFSAEDSEHIEKSYLKAVENDGQSEPVNVNEDYLYSVNVVSRELSPIYWDGPVYRILRGTWFFSRGDKLYPCEENLATQVEEGYLNSCPYREFSNEKDSAAAQSKTWALLGRYTGGFVQYTGSRNARLVYDDFYRNVSVKIMNRFSPASFHRSDKLVRGYELDMLESNSKPSTPVPTEELTSTTLLNDSSDPSDNFTPSNTESTIDLPSATDASHLMSRPDREVNHLILCCHGIGQKMGERVETVSFVKDISNFRKTLKKTFNSSPDLQAVYPKLKGGGNGVQCLPLLWRQDIRFGMARDLDSSFADDDDDDDESLNMSRDLALDDLEDDSIPTLDNINIPTVTGLRNIISDVLLDVLLYCQPNYRDKILAAVVKRLNRLYNLYKKNVPSFNGHVSLLGHSLGALILFDIIRYQGNIKYSKLQLDFPVANFFALGSPLGLFQMLNGKKIAGPIPKTNLTRSLSYSEQSFDSGVSILSCQNFYNIFHPTDPISYRVEPLVVKQMARLKPQKISHFRPHQDLSSSGVGHKIAGGALNVLSGLRSGIANTLILKSLSYASVFNEATADSHDESQGAENIRDWHIDERMYRLNKTGRIDFMLQEGALDTSYSYVSAMNAHSEYWKNVDLAHFILTQLL
ncbi:mitochondrial DDHD family phospholipase [Schizosaccharomyces pombe]|uniref:Probable phospholipase C20G8.02, mitochondrial n=1 Tax=Schizosaccharomyces pombe (strain 972 / ATCC 24843) TaxID=284812 RepID=YDK2_SCHPO|nr:putative DDHD family phospholipase [Schizosaccharomyces pombe]P87109.1 RecName: Full=Probable phospholipase C20G8.02, mitochondrial; Flags: Precursor [Schizosaccharomyces pombe 972h-]CAB08596.1 mitochondrial DDHD family phospholipase (predicted) [Schizosaccharomyces pombe]|eukprot:NP_593319.1 putative DDHD family phospholipase [Schizosaccharomyces pombe]